MINIPLGEGPKLTIEKVQLPFSGVHIGQYFDMKAKVKLDMINPEGPSCTLEVHQVSFPGFSQGTMQAKKTRRNKKAQDPTR